MHYLRSAAPILVSAGLLGLLAYMIDFGAAGERLLSLTPIWLGLATAAMVANVLLASWRYCIVVRDLRGIGPRFWPVFKVNLLSLFLTQILPMAVLADIARGAATWRVLGLNPSTAGISIVHDRLLALGGVVLCMALVLPFWPMVHVFREVILASLFIVAIAFAGVAFGFVVGRLARRLHYSPLSTLNHYALTFASHLTGRASLTFQFALALAGMATFALQLWALARGLDIELSLSAAIAFAPAIYLAQVLPFVYAGFGSREAVTVVMLTGGGHAAASAAALGLAVGVSNLLVSLPGALVALQVLDFRPRA